MLISKTEKEATRQKGWRVPASLVAYVEGRAGKHRGGQAEVVSDALSVHRALFETLSERAEALQRFAEEQGLDLRDSGKIVARFAELALEPHEKRKR